MKTKSALLAMLVLFSALCSHAATSVVSIKPIPPAELPTPGKTSILTIELDIAKPYHINSNHPLQEFLIPTTLQIEPVPGITFGKQLFPDAPPRTLKFSSDPMSVYEGTVKINIEMTPDAGATASQIPIKGKVRYQACNDVSCLPPVTQSFGITIAMNANGAAQKNPAVESRQAEPKSDLKHSSEKAETGNPLSPEFKNRGLFSVALLVFLSGLALNLTPCVYPMIPITISYFGGQSQGKKGSLMLHALLYVVGMAATYSILGGAAALTGGFFGAALRYPAVLIGIAAVMLLLALSMFDVYELRMPQFLNRLAGSSQKGFFGTLLMGLTVGIVAAPCIGPFVLALFAYVGNQGSAFLGFGLFFILALGLGVPFLALAAFSGSLNRLPRSGAWMIWVRKIFGFILLCMAFYFLKPLFPSALEYGLSVALILLVGGIYLAWIDDVASAGKGFSFVRNLVGAIFFAAALYFAATGIESKIESARSSLAGSHQGMGVDWRAYSDEIYAQAAREKKPIIIDFYADWCAPCKELDEKTFSAREVIDESKKFIMIKVDLTSAGDPQAEALRNKHQAVGVPTLLFIAPDGNEISKLRGTGFETKEEMLEKMKMALTAAGS